LNLDVELAREYLFVEKILFGSDLSRYAVEDNFELD
jgi:hypothetical protein